MAVECVVIDDACVVELIVTHRWYVFMAILDSDIRHRRMSARSPRGPPRVVRIVLFAPHTRWMINGVRASEPRSRRVQQASAQARARQLSGISLWMTG